MWLCLLTECMCTECTYTFSHWVALFTQKPIEVHVYILFLPLSVFIYLHVPLALALQFLKSYKFKIDTASSNIEREQSF